MRRLALAAALVLAVPAAAQPDPAHILLGALEQAARNAPERVRDFTLSVSADDFRTQFYAWRDGNQFYESAEDEDGTGGYMLAALLWPDLVALHYDGMDARDEHVAAAEYVRADTVEGRPVHVLMAPGLGLHWELADMPDSTLVYVDAETRQVLRLAVSGEQEPSGRALLRNGGRAELAVTFGDYRETDGLTAPRRMRLEMRMRLNLDDADRQTLRAEGTAAAAEVEAEGGDSARHNADLIRRMVGLIDGEPLVLDIVVHQVRVNGGAPDWRSF